MSEFCELLKTYRVSEVRGDKYAGEWPRERFSTHGVVYKPSEQVKSEIYLSALPLLNSGRCELLDHPRLISQLLNLERKTSRGGRDSVDHGPNQHDDIANSALGALRLVAQPVGWIYEINKLSPVEPKEAEPVGPLVPQRAVEPVLCPACGSECVFSTKEYKLCRECGHDSRKPEPKQLEPDAEVLARELAQAQKFDSGLPFFLKSEFFKGGRQ